MYRKKERLDKSYAKEPLLVFFKSYRCNILCKIYLANGYVLHFFFHRLGVTLSKFKLQRREQ